MTKHNFKVCDQVIITNSKGRHMTIDKLFNTVFKGCAFSNMEDNYLIHYSQPCVIMEGSWVESEVTVYEFIHECKQWAYDNGFVIGTLFKTDYVGSKESLAWAESILFDGRENFKASTEPEAVIKAAQWILDGSINKDIL